MSAYEFMGDHPILTFFLASIIASAVVNIVRAICGKR